MLDNNSISIVTKSQWLYHSTVPMLSLNVIYHAKDDHATDSEAWSAYRISILSNYQTALEADVMMRW